MLPVSIRRRLNDLIYLALKRLDIGKSKGKVIFYLSLNIYSYGQTIIRFSSLDIHVESPKLIPKSKRICMGEFIFVSKKALVRIHRNSKGVLKPRVA
mgnify:CR=1 FL=1